MDSHMDFKVILNVVCVHEGKKFFECDICDKKFTQKLCINRRLSSVHEVKNPFQCNMCDIRISTKLFAVRGHSNVILVLRCSVKEET